MKLAEWLRANERNDAWLADEIGCDRSFVTKLRNGKAEPSLRIAGEIFHITAGNVTPNDFLEARPGSGALNDVAIGGEVA